MLMGPVSGCRALLLDLILLGAKGKKWGQATYVKSGQHPEKLIGSNLGHDPKFWPIYQYVP